MLRIGWLSNWMAVGTGYGIQSKLTIPRLQAMGHFIVHPAFYGPQGTPIEIEGVLTLPTSKDSYGNDVMVKDFKYWNLDIMITLIDAWIFHPGVTSAVRWVPYFPVDCDPMPPMVADILRTAYKPIAYSKFGVAKAEEAGFKVSYVPHGVDTKFYTPQDKIETRQKLGLSEEHQQAFVVSIVAANKGTPSRKAFDQQIRAFAEFNRRHPDSLLSLHTDVWGGYDGDDIKRIIALTGIDPACIAMPPEYEFLRGMITPAYMRDLYNASDVLLNCTRGEGFGVPIVEAMSCGIPAIVTDFSAMPELIDAGAGWKVPYVDKFFYQNSYQVIPSVAGIVEALEQAYEAKQTGKLAEMGKQARDGMVRDYDADLVAEQYWRPALAEIESEIRATEAKKVARAEQRAKLRANGAPEQPVVAPSQEVMLSHE